MICLYTYIYIYTFFHPFILYTCIWNTSLRSLIWKMSGPFRPCKCDCVRDSKVSMVLGCVDGCGDGGDCFNCLAWGPQISQVRQFYLHIQRELRSNATWRKGLKLNLQAHFANKTISLSHWDFFLVISWDAKSTSSCDHHEYYEYLSFGDPKRSHQFPVVSRGNGSVPISSSWTTGGSCSFQGSV